MPIYSLFSSEDAVKDADMISYAPFQSKPNSLALPSQRVNNIADSGLDTTLVNIPAPKNLDYKYKDSSYFSALYRMASYYFYNCSVLSTSIIRISTETVRRGYEWVPKFNSKCPKCSTQFPKSVTKCSVCGFQGRFIKPDVTQQKILTNWEGGSLLDKVNKYGWDLEMLATSYITLLLTYNQPVILCKSVYIADKHGLISDEIPQEFIPVAPASARMIYDERGQPGDGTGFCIFERNKAVMMEGVIKDTGYEPLTGHKIYPARWCMSEDLTGQGDGAYYAEQEIFTTTYGVTSINYGLPLSMLIATEIKAWIAASLRLEKYYTTGHPQGIFVISGIAPDAFATVKRSVEVQMKSDPYSMPMLGIPPAQDRLNVAKWIPFSDNPTQQMITVMDALKERIASIFGIPGLAIGDINSMKGNANEQHQIAILDRTLNAVRKKVNALFAFILSKYPQITDWNLRLVEPPDGQSKDEEDERNKRYQNALLLQQMGFEIISQQDGVIEVSATPRSYDPIKALTDNMLKDGDNTNNSTADPDSSMRWKRSPSDLMDKPREPSKTFAPQDAVEDATKSLNYTVSVDTIARLIDAIAKNGGSVL